MLLVYTDEDFYAGAGFDRAWTDALAGIGCELDVVARPAPEWATEGPPRDVWSLAIAHVLVEDVVSFAPTFRTAALLERAGVPLLNPVSAIVASSDKLATHAIWAAHNLRQPAARDLAG